MDALRHDTRLALRYLYRNPGFSAGAIVILALGISLSATLFAIVRGALLRPWPYRGYERIVTVRADYPAQGRTQFSLWSVPEIEDLRAEREIFEDVIAGDALNVNLTHAGRPERVLAAVITPNAFSMLGVPALVGRTLMPDDARPGAESAVVISFGFWQARLGGDPRIVGRMLRIAGTPYTIVGVMPRQFVFWDRDLWLPLTLDPSDRRDDRRYYVQARLRPGVTIPAARSLLRTVTERLAADHPERPEYSRMTVAIGSLVDDVLRDLRPTLYLLLGAVALLVVVATANLANAALAQGIRREGELAVRRAIGASAAQLARQLLVEYALLGAAAGLVGAAGAAFLLPEIVALVPHGYIPAEATVELDWRIVALATFVAAVCGLAIGVAPAVRAARVDPAGLLREGDTRTASRRRHRWTNRFVFAQLTLAIVILGAAATSALALRRAVDRDPGYRSTGVWTARIALGADTDPEARRIQYRQMLARIQANAAVAQAAVASFFPIGRLPTRLVGTGEGALAAGEAKEAAVLAVSPGFFRLLRMPIAQGRAFVDADEPPRRPVAMVTRNLARQLWPDGRWLERRVVIGVGERAAAAATVVGVVDDITPDGGTTLAQPALFVPIAFEPPMSVVLGVASGGRSDTLAVVDAAVHEVNPDVPVYGVETLERSRINMLGPRLLAVTLLAVFGVAVLALSSVGVYAVVAQSVQERAQEFRIKLSFGAEPRQLFASEILRAGRLIACAALSGGAAAAAAMRLLAHSFPGLGTARFAPLIAATAIIVAVALTAVAIPSWRATRFAR